MKMSSYVFGIITALIIFIAGTPVFAGQVTVSGYGISSDDAERDALRNAVQQAVGTMVDSETLVQNSVLVNDEIYTQSKGYINNYSVLSKRLMPDGNYEVKIAADVDTSPSSKLMNELTRLGIINRKLRDPKIAVMISEYHVNARVRDPAAETAVIQKLIDAGFSRITDISQQRQDINKASALNDQDMKNLAGSLNVDILVVGEAFSEGAGDVGKFIGNGRRDVGIVSCKARAEAKIYVVKTGQIISANGMYGTAADISELIAGKKALGDAGAKLGDYIVEKLLDYGSSNNQNIEIIVNASDFNRVNAISNALKSIRGVENAMVTNYNAGMATISLKYSGTPQTLFNQLNQALTFNINLQQFTYNTLTINAY